MDREDNISSSKLETCQVAADGNVNTDNNTDYHSESKTHFTVKSELLKGKEDMSEILPLRTVSNTIEEGANSDDDFHSASEGNDESDSELTFENDMNNIRTHAPNFVMDRNQTNVDYDEQEEVSDDPDKENENEKPETDAERELELRKRLEDSLTAEELEDKQTQGQTLKDEGNKQFRSGDYDPALEAYTKALEACPLSCHKERAVLFSNRAACYMKKHSLDLALQDSSSALELHPQYLKALLRRAELHERLDKLDEALKDYQGVLELDPQQHAARASCMKLTEQIKDRNEKMKEEMMDKLKDLGNLVLRPFGLSTNNFALQQDPNTGGYSVNFKNNGS